MPSKPVTVDSDDLEALIQAANVTVMVERAISAAKQDPIYRRTQDAFSEASDRIQRARNDAIRVLSPAAAQPLTDWEYQWIDARLQRFKAIEERLAAADQNSDDLLPVELHDPLSVAGKVGDVNDARYAKLLEKRLIEAGLEQVLMTWGGSKPVRTGIPEMWFRLTARGEAEMERIERERRAAKAKA